MLQSQYLGYFRGFILNWDDTLLFDIFILSGTGATDHLFCPDITQTSIESAIEKLFFTADAVRHLSSVFSLIFHCLIKESVIIKPAVK